MDRRKINKRGGSNKGMADGFFLQNKYPWRHRNSIAQSIDFLCSDQKVLCNNRHAYSIRHGNSIA